MANGEKAESDYPLEPALDFLQRLWRLNHALEKLSSRMEKRIGVTAQQRLVLRCIGKYPGITAGQLAVVLHLDPGSVSVALNRLEKRGLLDRKRDPLDKRRASLKLTATGRRLDQPDASTVEGAAERLLATASPRDMAATMRVLDKLTGLLGVDVAIEPDDDGRRA